MAQPHYYVIVGAGLGLAIGFLYAVPYLAPLAKTIASLGPVIAQKLLTVIDIISKKLCNMISKIGLKTFINILTTIIKFIIEENTGGKVNPDEFIYQDILDSEGNKIGVNIIMKDISGFPIRGHVTFNDNSQGYAWKFSGGNYYIQLCEGGDWILITDPDWKPGDPLPEDVSAS